MGISQINLLNLLVTEKEFQNPVHLGGPKPHALSAEGLRNAVLFVAVADPSALLYLPYLVIRAILDGGAGFRESCGD
jgi:hypothetical protein